MWVNGVALAAAAVAAEARERCFLLLRCCCSVSVLLQLMLQSVHGKAGSGVAHTAAGALPLPSGEVTDGCGTSPSWAAAVAVAS